MTGTDLKRIRRELKLSAKKAARLLNVHERTVWRWESSARLSKRMGYVETVLRSAAK